MTDELRLLRSTLDEAIGARFPAEWEPGSATELDREAWSEASELGWDQIGLPVEQGGFGKEVAALVVLAQASGAHRLPLPLVETALARTVLAAGDLEQPA